MSGDEASAESGLTPGQGCGRNPSELAKTLTIDGVQRSFELYVPREYEPERAYPLIYAWHGRGLSGMQARGQFALERVVGGDAIIVYPDALPLDSGDGGAGWVFDPAGRDHALFDQLHGYLRDSLCIDDDEVYSTGWSHGAMMSHNLGCYRGELFAAIAPVAGAPTFDFGPCHGDVAVWAVHGRNDDILAVERGRAARDRWLAAHTCTAATTPTEPSPCVAYEGCARAVHWCEHSGGHPWPSFAAEGMWRFFRGQ